TGAVIGTIVVFDRARLFGLLCGLACSRLLAFSSLFGVSLCFGLSRGLLLLALCLLFGRDWLICRARSDRTIRVYGFGQSCQAGIPRWCCSARFRWRVRRSGGNRPGHRRRLCIVAINAGVL